MVVVIRSLVALALAMLSMSTWAHGGVGIEDDKCVLKIGQMKAHFSGYQPELRASQEFCEDIPEVSRAVMVIDFVDPQLRTKRVDFRILKDAAGTGMGTTLKDLGNDQTIAANTLIKLDEQTYPHGTVTLDYGFTSSGWYVGLLSVKDPATGQTVHSVFPFKVGERSHTKYYLLLAAVAVFTVLMYRLTHPKS